MNTWKKKTLEEWVDVAVVGAGHAGCEAALACARLGRFPQSFRNTEENGPDSLG